MESNQTIESVAAPVERPDVPRIPVVVDWIVAALVTIVGLALLVGGTAIMLGTDRAAIASAVADGTIESASLSSADLVEVVLATATWTAIGLLATGAVLALGGVAYAVVRRRAHAHSARGDATNEYVANGVVGAVVSALLSFVPFAPVFGGAVAGYLERGESDRVVGVGALSGVLAMVPILAIVTAALAGVVAGLLAVDQGGLALLVGTVLLLSLMIVATVGAGLGAIGGYVGGSLSSE